MSDTVCSHFDEIEEIKGPERPGCAECVPAGAVWVHLRTCQRCGVTLCCDDSPNKHASNHARTSSHPVIASAEPGEFWLYCYPDGAFTEYSPR
jgi:hypothetical protein